MNIDKLYINSLLAEASYADFWNEETGQSITDTAGVLSVLVTSGCSKTQAEEFVSHWRVVDHQPNTSTGFSATVFESIDNPGEFSISVRGTEMPGDIKRDLFLTDFGDIGGDGIALYQAIDLINYYQRLTTVGDVVQFELYEGPQAPPAGVASQVIGYEYDNNHSGNNIPNKYRYIRVTQPAAGLGIISDTVENFDISGHSLGGHLAMILARLDEARVNGLYTYNAPGFDGGIVFSADTEWFFEAVAEAQTTYLGSTSVGDFPADDLITNVTVEEDIVSAIGTMSGGNEEVYSEVDTTSPATNWVPAHYITGVTDSLAVQSLLAGSAVDLDLQVLGDVLRASTNKFDMTMESVVDALGDLFSVGTAIVRDDREGLYQRIQLIKQDAKYIAAQEGWSVVSLVTIDAETLLTLAKSDIAYRYALLNFNAFAVLGADNIYDAHNTAEELNLQGVGDGSLTDEWLSDRITYLKLLMQRNLDDYVGTASRDESLDGAMYYDANTSNSSIATGDAEVGVVNDLADRIYFGSDAEDKPATGFNGGSGNDHLYTMGGDDDLYGRKGEDYLEGGTGNDTYFFSFGDGKDTVFDVSGTNTLYIEHSAGGGHKTIGVLSQISQGSNNYRELDADVPLIRGQRAPSNY